MSSPIVLSWDHTLERECRLTPWKHGAPWKHGSVKDGKVERPFHLGEEHTELTLCLSWPVANNHKAESNCAMHNGKGRMVERTFYLEYSPTTEDVQTTKMNKLSSKPSVHQSRAAFGLLGNKGIHSYNGNMWVEDLSEEEDEYCGDSQDYSYNSYYFSSREEQEAFNQSMRELDTPSDLSYTSEEDEEPHPNRPPPCAGQQWEEIVRSIIKYEDVEERFYEDKPLLHALAWEAKSRLEESNTEADFNNIEPLVLNTITNIAQGKGKYIDWIREAHKIANEIDHVLSKTRWLLKIPNNPWLANDPKAKLATLPPISKPKPAFYKVLQVISTKTFAIKKMPIQKTKKHHNEIVSWLSWACTKPPTTYKWWQRASPTTTRGDQALGSHKVKHSKGMVSTLPRPTTGDMKETSFIENASRVRRGYKPTKRKIKAKPIPKVIYCLLSFSYLGMLDAPEPAWKGYLESRSSANTSGV